eukprot:COSAG01_NODE_4108_length_5340_cov_53.162183_3_plen_245_part_00
MAAAAPANYSALAARGVGVGHANALLSSSAAHLAAVFGSANASRWPRACAQQRLCGRGRPVPMTSNETAIASDWDFPYNFILSSVLILGSIMVSGAQVVERWHVSGAGLAGYANRTVPPWLARPLGRNLSDSPQPTRTVRSLHVAAAALHGGCDLAPAAAHGGAGELFLRVHWVAVPKAVRARRVNRRPGLAGGGGQRAARVLPAADDAGWPHRTDVRVRAGLPPREPCRAARRLGNRCVPLSV